MFQVKVAISTQPLTKGSIRVTEKGQMGWKSPKVFVNHFQKHRLLFVMIYLCNYIYHKIYLIEIYSNNWPNSFPQVQKPTQFYTRAHFDPLPNLSDPLSLAPLVPCIEVTSFCFLFCRPHLWHFLWWWYRYKYIMLWIKEKYRTWSISISFGFCSKSWTSFSRSWSRFYK